jgi:ABC-type dipeptide/oligopeptide/nickel transport system permease subunit
LKRNPLLMVGIGFLVLLVLFAVFGPLAGGGITETKWGTFEMPSSRHLLGTDELGRDVLARIAYGARVSLAVGLTVQVLALVIGVIAGMIGTFGPKWLSITVMRFTDGMFAFPDILLAILIIGLLESNSSFRGGVFGKVMESGFLPVVVALSITAWPSFARLTNTTATSLKDREFVVAAKALGAPPAYVIVRHVLPQMWGILLAVSMVELAGTILAEATLSFLGIGILPPYPSWGSMINLARDDMVSHPLWLLWPCLILSLTIFALNFVGDGLRAILDPRRK